MNGNAKKETSDSDAAASQQSGNAGQGARQPADEEIGDYADRNAVQVDGGDNSVVADQPEEETGAAKKKPDAP